MWWVKKIFTSGTVHVNEFLSIAGCCALKFDRFIKTVHEVIVIGRGLVVLLCWLHIWYLIITIFTLFQTPLRECMAEPIQHALVPYDFRCVELRGSIFNCFFAFWWFHYIWLYHSKTAIPAQLLTTSLGVLNSGLWRRFIVIGIAQETIYMTRSASINIFTLLRIVSTWKSFNNIIGLLLLLFLCRKASLFAENPWMIVW